MSRFEDEEYREEYREASSEDDECRSRQKKRQRRQTPSVAPQQREALSLAEMCKAAAVKYTAQDARKLETPAERNCSVRALHNMATGVEVTRGEFSLAQQAVCRPLNMICDQIGKIMAQESGHGIFMFFPARHIRDKYGVQQGDIIFGDEEEMKEIVDDEMKRKMYERIQMWQQKRSDLTRASTNRAPATASTTATASSPASATATATTSATPSLPLTTPHALPPLLPATPYSFAPLLPATSLSLPPLAPLAVEVPPRAADSRGVTSQFVSMEQLAATTAAGSSATTETLQAQAIPEVVPDYVETIQAMFNPTWTANQTLPNQTLPELVVGLPLSATATAHVSEPLASTAPAPVPDPSVWEHATVSANRALDAADAAAAPAPLAAAAPLATPAPASALRPRLPDDDPGKSLVQRSFDAAVAAATAAAPVAVAAPTTAAVAAPTAAAVPTAVAAPAPAPAPASSGGEGRVLTAQERMLASRITQLFFEGDKHIMELSVDRPDWLEHAGWTEDFHTTKVNPPGTSVYRLCTTALTTFMSNGFFKDAGCTDLNNFVQWIKDSSSTNGSRKLLKDKMSGYHKGRVYPLLVRFLFYFANKHGGNTGDAKARMKLVNDKFRDLLSTTEP